MSFIASDHVDARPARVRMSDQATSYEAALLQQHFDDADEQQHADDLFGSSDSEDQVHAATSTAARVMLPTGGRRSSSGAGAGAAAAQAASSTSAGEAARTRSGDPSTTMVKSPTLRVRNSLSPIETANPEHASPSPSSSTPPTGTNHDDDDVAVNSKASKANKGKGKAKTAATTRKRKQPAPAWPTRSRSSTPLPPARFTPRTPTATGEASQSALASEMRNDALRKKRTVLEAATVGDVELTQRAKRQRLAAAERQAAADRAAATSPVQADPPQLQQQAQRTSFYNADGTLDFNALLSASDEDLFAPLDALASTASALASGSAAGPAPPSGAATPGSPAYASPGSNADLLAQALAMANDAQSHAASSPNAADVGTSMEELLGIAAGADVDGGAASWLSDPLASGLDLPGGIITPNPLASAAAGEGSRPAPLPYTEAITPSVRRGAKTGGKAKTVAEQTLKRALAERDESASPGGSPSASASAPAKRRRADSNATTTRRRRSSASSSASVSPPLSNDDAQQRDGTGDDGDAAAEKSNAPIPPSAAATGSGVGTRKEMAKKLAPVMPKQLRGGSLRAAVLERVAARRASSSTPSRTSASPARGSIPPQRAALTSLLARRIEDAEAAQEKLQGSLFRLKVDQHVLASARQVVDERIVAIGQERLAKSKTIGKGKGRAASAAAAGAASKSTATTTAGTSKTTTTTATTTTEEAPSLERPPPLTNMTAARREGVNVYNAFEEVLSGGFEAESHLSDGLY